MTTIFIKRNPFTGEMLLERDGKMIPQVAKLSCLRNRFIQQAFSLYSDVQDEYNDDELTVSLCTSCFEVFLFSAISGQGSIFQVVRQDFLVNTPLQERLSKIVSLLSKYSPNEQLIAPLAIQVFCPDETVFNAFKEKLEQDYPELKQIGISIEKTKNRSSVNLVQNEEEISSSSGLFSAPPGAGFKTVFVLSDEGKIRLDNDTVYWPLTSRERYEIIKSYIERFYVFDYVKRLIQSFPKDKLSEEDRFLLETLDKVDETVLISLPKEIEIGTTSIAMAKTFSGDPCPELEVESTYPEIIVAEVGDVPGKIVLHAMSVGDSEIKIKRAGDFTPFYQNKVSVINYDYATSVAMLVNGNSVRNHVFTPGDSAQISLKYTPADSPKTKEDVQNGKWSVSDPQILSFDPKTSVVSAKKPGFSKLKIALTRVSAEIPFVVKPKISDFSISLLNPPNGNEQEIRYSEKSKNEPEYIKLIIGSELKFSYSLIPEGCLPATAVVECSPGLQIKQAPDQTHFSIVAKRIGHNETLRIRVPGCQRVILITIEIIPHPGTSDNSSKIPTYIGIAATGAIILWLLVLFGMKINVFLGIIGTLFLVLDFVVRKKIQEDEKGSSSDKANATRNVTILIGVTILAILVSLIPSCEKRSKYEYNDSYEQPSVQSNTTNQRNTQSTSSQEVSSSYGNNNRNSSSSSTSTGTSSRTSRGSTVSSSKSSASEESNKTEVDPFSQPGTSSKIRITNIENELSPVNVDSSNYDNGIIQKFWMGALNYDKWSYSYFASSDNAGEIVDNGNLYFGSRKLQTFSPEIVFLSKRLRAYATNQDMNLISCHSLLKIDHGDVYQFIVSHYDMPAKWSCGAYALYIDGKELIFLKTDKKYAYNNFVYSSDKRIATKSITDNNKTYTAKAKLAEGYHDFLFVQAVYSKMPQASNSSIAIKGALSSNPRTLNVSDMYIPKSKIPQEKPPVETSDITISELPPAFQDEIKNINSEITRINKSLSSERNKLSRAKTQMQNSKTPEKMASNVESLQKTVDSLEAALNEQGKKLKLIYSQLNMD